MTPMGKKRRRGVARAVAEVRLLSLDYCSGQCWGTQSLEGWTSGLFLNSQQIGFLEYRVETIRV